MRIAFLLAKLEQLGGCCRKAVRISAQCLPAANDAKRERAGVSVGDAFCLGIRPAGHCFRLRWPSQKEKAVVQVK
jgi:hypothetical protein